MAKYVLTLVFLGLLITLFFYPTPGDTLDENYQFQQERIVPTELKAGAKQAVKAAFYDQPEEATDGKQIQLTLK